MNVRHCKRIKEEEEAGECHRCGRVLDVRTFFLFSFLAKLEVRVGKLHSDCGMSQQLNGRSLNLEQCKVVTQITHGIDMLMS